MRPTTLLFKVIMSGYPPPNGEDQSFDDDFENLLESDDEFGRYLENIGSFPMEQLPEVMATITLTYVKGNFEGALVMVKASIKNLAENPELLANWRNAVQARLRETSNEELGIDESQRQQFEQVLLDL